MAKKGKTGMLGLLAFVAMILNAIAWLLQALNVNVTVGGCSLTTLFTGIASLFLIIVAAVVAYDFAKHQTTVWRVIYWILTILSFCAILFGVGRNFF